MSRLEQILENIKEYPFIKKIEGGLPDEISKLLEEVPESELGDMGLVQSLQSLSRFKGIKLERIMGTLKEEYLLFSFIEGIKPKKYLFPEMEYQGLLDIIKEFRDKSTFAEQERFYYTTHTFNRYIIDVPHFSKNTFTNLTAIASIFRHPIIIGEVVKKYNKILSAGKEFALGFERMFSEAISVNVDQQDTVDYIEYIEQAINNFNYPNLSRYSARNFTLMQKLNVPKEFTNKYNQIMELLRDKRSIFVFDSLLNSNLEATEIPDDIDKRKSRSVVFMNYFNSLAIEFENYDDHFKAAILYFFNYLEKKQIIEPNQSIDTLIKLVKSNSDIGINKYCYYGLFYKFAFSMLKINRNKYNKSLSEDPDEFHLGYTLRDLFREGQYLSFSLNDILSNENEFMEKIESVSRDLNEYFLKNNKFKDLYEPGDYDGGKSIKKFGGSFFKLDKDLFLNSLSLLYFSLENKDSFLNMLDSYKEDPMSFLFLNYFLKNWNLKSGIEPIKLKLDIFKKISETQFEYKRFVSGMIIKTDDDTYNKRILPLINSGLNPEEITELAVYESNERFLKKLGSGTVGTTYLVYSRDFRKEMAMKVIRGEEYNPEESELLSKISHKNVVKIWYAGNNFVKKFGKEVYALLMDYVDGNTFSELIDENPNGLDLEQVIDYSSQLLDGINYLHSQGIFHRDIRPKNVKLNSSKSVKIIDFGTAVKNLKAEIKGNRRYGGRNDIFSWGFMTYELINGAHFVAPRGSDMSSEEYAEKIKSYKKRMRDKSGKLTRPYQKKIDVLPEELREPLRIALENTADLSEEDRINKITLHYNKLRVDPVKKKKFETTLGHDITTEQYFSIIGTIRE
jgi:tRNA A-37 threonylcarbamoyl transferase component Bud32